MTSAHMPLVKARHMAITNIRGNKPYHVTGRKRTKVSVHSPDDHYTSLAHAHKNLSLILLHINEEPIITRHLTKVSNIKIKIKTNAKVKKKTK